MAIITATQGQYEVKIKRVEDGTYFDEYYVGGGEGEHAFDARRERYIVAEPGTRFSIEVTLKQDFDFGIYTSAVAQLKVPGRKNPVAQITLIPRSWQKELKDDLVGEIKCADVTIGGQKMLGAELVFRGIGIDQNLSDESDIKGINPKDLSTFSVVVCRRKEERTLLTPDEYAIELANWKSECEKNNSGTLKRGRKRSTQDPWDAKMVDEDSYNKHGITSAVGFVGGSVVRTVPNSATQPCRLPKPSQLKCVEKCGRSYTFIFHCRTTEYLGRAGRIRCLPAAALYGDNWETLTEEERRAILEYFEELSDAPCYEYEESETDKILPRVDRANAQNQSRDHMCSKERRQAFDGSQFLEQQKLIRRGGGKLQQEYKNMIGQVTSIDAERTPTTEDNTEVGEEPTETAPTSQRTQKQRIQGVEVKLEGIRRSMLKELKDQDARACETSQNSIKPVMKAEVADEDSDDDEVIIVSISPRKSVPPSSLIGPAQNDMRNADEELRKMEEEAEKLKKDIEQEERLIEMKRKRDALQERIEAARAKKIKSEQ